jgi:uncharacterized membrane protein (DUF106 family)
MWLTDDEQKALLITTVGKTTEKIARAVQEAMRALGLGALQSDIERVYKMAEHFDKRQEKLIKAQLRSLAAQSSTFKSNIEDNKD